MTVKPKDMNERERRVKFCPFCASTKVDPNYRCVDCGTLNFTCRECWENFFATDHCGNTRGESKHGSS